MKNKKATHTVGPWEVTKGLYGNKNELTIWGAHEINECGDSVQGFVATMGSPFKGENSANARLISAAPELLVALEIVMAELKNFGAPTPRGLQLAGKAIRKAKGERGENGETLGTGSKSESAAEPVTNRAPAGSSPAAPTTKDQEGAA